MSRDLPPAPERPATPPLSRRVAIARMGAAVGALMAAPSSLAAALPTHGHAAPSVLRRRYRLFAGAADDYSERAIRLVRESTVVDMLHGIGAGGEYLEKPEEMPEEEILSTSFWLNF